MSNDAVNEARHAVRPIADHEFDAVAACLGRAFHEDPVATYFFPERTAARYTTFTRAVLPTLAGHAHYTTIDGIPGAALWQPPSPPEGSVLENLLNALRMAWAAGSALGRVARVGQAMAHHRPVEPHWYLAMLGTDPAQQGRGVGSALLHETLSRCDREGTLAYLETSTEKNVRFYESHGFRVDDVIQEPESPKLWVMSRRPR